ncbi:MAG: insulinase family protein, partial [Ignavibacteria bacterium]|nr:insulinase family protein [Ignavibacteria bacterium]
MDIRFTELKLKNGLNVILTKDDTIPSASLHITYHVGSKDEKDGEKGYAHLIEHLMFEGSSYLKPGEYDRLISERGCENNAYT